MTSTTISSRLVSLALARPAQRTQRSPSPCGPYIRRKIASSDKSAKPGFQRCAATMVNRQYACILRNSWSPSLALNSVFIDQVHDACVYIKFPPLLLVLKLYHRHRDSSLAKTCIITSISSSST